ncbi:MAG: hypothetical protein H7Y36_06560 [Armatimonadetes bacterium]|nr:hypothetical protein [Akkermansiaceae bacterium]
MAFLKKVQSGEINLEPGGDTALSPQTVADKKEVIRKRLERLGKDLRHSTLELGEVKEDEGFAAVMVRKVGGFETNDFQIIPVAMVKRGADWVPAPVLASFENAVIASTFPLRERLGELEKWMLEERVLDLGKIISESAERTRAEIKKNFAGVDLKGDNPEKIADRFLEACGSRNQAAILGFLGGLGEPLPEDWSARLRASELAVAERASSRMPWRLLVSPDVLRVRVLEERDNDSGLFSIACLDPSRTKLGGTMETIRVLHFELTKDSNAFWRIDLPSALLNGDEAGLSDADDIDGDLLDLFPKRLRQHEPVVQSKTARQAAAAVISKLETGSLGDLLRLVDFAGKLKEARIGCSAAAEFWWSLNAPGAFRFPISLGYKEEGALAVATYQWFSPNEADLFELRSLYFIKSEEGWLWAPGIVEKTQREEHKTLSKWVKDQTPGWRISWRETLLKPSAKLETLNQVGAASDEEVRKLSALWLEALETRDIHKALGQTAWLGGKDAMPVKCLRNLSYDIASAKDGKGKLSGIYRSEHWVAAGIQYSSKGQKKNSFYPVFMTKSGPKILPEIDLLSGDNRTRKFLNDSSFAQLARFVEKDKLDELKNIFARFENDLRKD